MTLRYIRLTLKNSSSQEFYHLYLDRAHYSFTVDKETFHIISYGVKCILISGRLSSSVYWERFINVSLPRTVLGMVICTDIAGCLSTHLKYPWFTSCVSVGHWPFADYIWFVPCHQLVSLYKNIKFSLKYYTIFALHVQIYLNGFRQRFEVNKIVRRPTSLLSHVAILENNSSHEQNVFHISSTFYANMTGN